VIGKLWQRHIFKLTDKPAIAFWPCHCFHMTGATKMPNSTVPAAAAGLPKESRRPRKESDFEAALHDAINTMSLVSTCLWDIIDNSPGSYVDGAYLLRVTEQQEVLQRSA
jgi:hypothetical protein